MKQNLTRDRNNRLGQGLDTLLGPEPTSLKEGSEQVLLLDIEKIQPGKMQPRRLFDKTRLEELASSLKKNGVLQPILIEQKGNAYHIIAGERRWRAAGLAGLRKIPAILKQPEPNQSRIWALIENIQREDLSAIEESRAFQTIMDENSLTQEDLAKKLGRSRSALANSLRLLQLDEEVQKLVESKQISFAQARELLRFKSPVTQRKMAQKCLKGLTVRGLTQKEKTKKNSSAPFWAKSTISHLQKEFSKQLKLNYREGRGYLSISFESDKELKDILTRLWK